MISGVFSTTVCIESTANPEKLRAGIRSMDSSRLLIDTPRFRWRQVLGWRLDERSDGFSLAPEYARNWFPARFVGRVEALGVGSRITGRIVQSFPRTLVAILFIALTALMGAAALAQRGEKSRKIAVTSAAMIRAVSRSCTPRSTVDRWVDRARIARGA